MLPVAHVLGKDDNFKLRMFTLYMRRCVKVKPDGMSELVMVENQPRLLRLLSSVMANCMLVERLKQVLAGMLKKTIRLRQAWTRSDLIKAHPGFILPKTRCTAPWLCLGVFCR